MISKKAHLILILFFFLLSLNAYGIDDSESLFTMGLNYYIQREYNRAAMEWKRVLDRHPNHPRAKKYMEKAFSKYNYMEINFYEGLEEFNNKKYPESVGYFQNTLMINPRHQKALFYLDLCYKLLRDQIDREKLSEESIIEANKMIEEEEFTKAIALYKIAILLEPDNEIAHMKLIEAQNLENIANQNLELMMHMQAAREFHDQEKYFEAIQEWSKALFLDPENEEVKKMLAIDKELLRKQQRRRKIEELLTRGIDLYDNNDYIESKETFRQVLKLDPKNETAHDYLKKINEILKILNNKKLRENEAEKHFILGVDYFNREKYEKSLNEFDFTLSIISNHRGALDYKQRALDMLKKLRKQREQEKNALIQKLLTEGIKLYQISEFENAIYNFKKVLEMAPDNEYAKEYLLLSEEALKLQRQSVINEDSPYYPIIKNLELKGIENIKKKKYLIALHYFTEIKELFPLNKEANKYILKIKMQTEPEEVKSILDRYFARGKKYYGAKNYQRALYEFDLIKSIDPTYPQIKKYWNLAKNPPSQYDKEIKDHFNKGLLYFAQKNYEKAIKEWRKSIELDKSPLTNKYLGRSLANVSKAQFRLKASKGQIIDTPVSRLSKAKTQKVNKHYYMGVAYYTGGDYQNALQEFRTVLKIDPSHSLAIKNIAKIKKRIKSQTD